jgi:hypothetical protein
MNVFVVQSGDGPVYVNIYATREAFLRTFDIEYRSTEDGEYLTAIYEEAADTAVENPGAPISLGDRDTLTYAEVTA